VICCLITCYTNRLVPTLALRWLLQPLPLDDYWFVLLLPLVIVISIVYKTIKLRNLSQLRREATRLCMRIIFFLMLAAAVIWLVTELA